MMPDPTLILNNPAIQWGFAFLCLVQLVLFTAFIWGVFGKLATIIRGNTQAVQRLCDKISQEDNLLIDLRDMLLNRPCLCDKKRLKRVLSVLEREVSLGTEDLENMERQHE